MSRREIRVILILRALLEWFSNVQDNNRILNKTLRYELCFVMGIPTILSQLATMWIGFEISMPPAFTESYDCSPRTPASPQVFQLFRGPLPHFCYLLGLGQNNTSVDFAVVCYYTGTVLYIYPVGV